MNSGYTERNIRIRRILYSRRVVLLRIGCICRRSFDRHGDLSRRRRCFWYGRRNFFRRANAGSTKGDTDIGNTEYSIIEYSIRKCR